MSSTCNLDLETLKLLKGNHAQRKQGLCIMEAVAYFAGEPHSDRPECASKALTIFAMKLNDSMDDHQRQMLKPFIPRLVGTRDDNDLIRGRILAWAAITEFAPIALRARGLDEHAKKLEALPRYDWKAAKEACEEERKATAAAAAAAAAKSLVYKLAIAALDRAIRLDENGPVKEI